MLDLQNLEAWRDDRCLFRALSLTLREGEVLRVAGPNGVGKTTLLQLVAGLAPLQAGDIRWRDQSRADDEQVFRQDMLFLGHLPGLKAMLTVAENLQFLAALRGQPLSDDRLVAALARVRLQGYEDSPVAQLSAGQKRRVALARLFTERALLWLLDEPFTAIDREGVADLEGWLADHAEAGGLVLLTTHHDLHLRCPLRQLDLQAPADEEGI